MNKLVLILISLSLSYASTLHAYDKTHTLSGGYIYGKIKGDTAKGEIISYRYETENAWGILISLLRLNANHKEHFIDPRFTIPSTIKYRTKTTGLLIGSNL
ncbi:hypothetical protein G9394_04190 [Proteus vulgaris]|nr:hypothetical protein G9394_04190 [Proteus vulgaris]